MKHSIRLKLSIIIMSLVAGLVVFCCVFNALFLEKYYIRQQQKALIQAFDSVKEVINGADIDQNRLGEVMYDISTARNMTALVVDSNFEKVYSLKTDIDKTKRWLQDYYFSQTDKESREIAKGDNYVIRTSYNIYDEQSYLEIIGNDDNYMYNVIIQVPLESISKNVGISNRFFIIVGIIGMLLGGIIAFFVAGQFTRPIKKLSLTAEAMAEMDFDVKYESKDKSEVGMLGESINKMSDNLKHYISDLKSANLELQKDIDKKEEIDNMRKDFISNVSHELKTPIALIQGYAEGLKDGITDDPESTQFYCDVIIDEAAKMNNMVKQLLTLNQLESGNDPLTIERFDIAKHIGEIARTNKIRAQQKNAEILYECNDSVYVWADQFKIEEVITNYISNAINHVENADRDSSYIKIWLEYIDSTKKKVRIHVFNTGKHIPEDDIGKIWDKFYKVDKARTREYGGSGVGLSIVKAIMNSHGQNFGAENVENGVDFWFELDCENA